MITNKNTSKYSEAQKKKWENPEYRKNISNKTKENWKKKEMKEKFLNPKNLDTKEKVLIKIEKLENKIKELKIFLEKF